MSKESRAQHIVPAILVFGLAATVTFLSYTQEPVDAFLFPRLIATAMLLFASWNLYRAVRGLAKVGEGVSLGLFKNILPGIVVMIVYVFWAAKTVGFYGSSAIVFFVLYSLYDSNSHGSARAWLQRLVVTLAFMGVMYLLFSVLLSVQTPRGIWL